MVSDMKPAGASLVGVPQKLTMFVGELELRANGAALLAAVRRRIPHPPQLAV